MVVAGIKSGDIPKAEDIRDKLTKIADIGGRLLEAFIEKPKSLETCYHKATEISDDVNLYRTLNKFRIKIGDLDTKRALVNMREVRQKKCVFELKKIKQSTDKLLKVLR